MNPDAFWFLLRNVSEEPPERPTRAVDPRTVRSAFELAESNGLLYALATRWIAGGNALPLGAEEPWREALQRREAFRRTIGDLNRASAASGRGYCLIKDYRSVENVPRDVDILVREADQPDFLAALESEGFEFAYRDEAEVSLSREGALRVDVYGRIHYLRRDFLDPDYLFSMSREYTTHGAAHPGLDAGAALLLNSAHGLFGHAELTLLDFLDYRKLRTEVSDFDSVRAVATQHGWGRVLDRWDGHLGEIGNRLYGERRPVRFPIRNGWRFIMDSVSALDGPPLSSHERRALSLSLLWDQLIFISETVGVARALRRSSLASLASNTAGHRLRLLRGDRKGTGAVEEARGNP